MTTDDNKNGRSPSTTWEFRKVKIRRPPPGLANTAPGGRPTGLFGYRDPREPLTITVRYRGGAESWWLIHARGRRIALPGWMALEDVMLRLNGHITVRLSSSD